MDMHDLLGMVDMWDAINDVVVASGGNAGNTSIARQNAVVKVERAIAALVRREVERARADEREQAQQPWIDATRDALALDEDAPCLPADVRKIALAELVEVAHRVSVMGLDVVTLHRIAQELKQRAAAIRARGEQGGTQCDA